MIEFYSIPGRPATKKNSQRILENKKTGRKFIMPSQKYIDYEKMALKELPKPDKPIDYPVNVRCIYYMDSKRRVDLSNLEEATDDILVKAGILLDDNRDVIAGHDGSRVLYDKDVPRTDIMITDVKNYEQWRLKHDN